MAWAGMVGTGDDLWPKQVVWATRPASLGGLPQKWLRGSTSQHPIFEIPFLHDISIPSPSIVKKIRFFFPEIVVFLKIISKLDNYFDHFSFFFFVIVMFNLYYIRYQRVPDLSTLWRQCRLSEYHWFLHLHVHCWIYRRRIILHGWDFNENGLTTWFCVEAF